MPSIYVQVHTSPSCHRIIVRSTKSLEIAINLYPRSQCLSLRTLLLLLEDNDVGEKQNSSNHWRNEADMSKNGGGRGGGGGGAVARVTIPESVRETILSIREITGKQHSDEDIFSALQDCSMDPNDTAQKLLHLDTFHEVKRKRDRKKEMSNTPSRGARSNRGKHSAKHVHSDAVVGRSAIHQRENGVLSLQVKENIKSDAAVPETKVSAVMLNGPSSLRNGRSPRCGPKSAAGGDVSITHDISDDDVKKLSSLSLLPAGPSSAPNEKSESVIQVPQGNSTSPTVPASVSGVYSSASDYVWVLSMNHHLGTVGAIKREIRSQQSVAEHDHMQGNKHFSSDVESELPKIEKASSIINPAVNEKMAPGILKAVKTNELAPGILKAVETNELSQTSQPSLPTNNNSLAVGPATATDVNHSSQESDFPLKDTSTEDAQAEESSMLLPEQTLSNGHVTFPDHFKVPETLKSGLTFGSFDANCGVGTKYSNGNGWDINSTHPAESSHETDDSARETFSSNQSISSTVVDHPDQPESPQVFDKVLKPEVDVVPTADSKCDKPAQEVMLFSEGHQNTTIQIAPNYGFGFMPPMHSGHFVEFEGHETQPQDVSRLSGFVNENPTASSSPSPTPTPTPTPTPPVQNPVAASPRPVLFRPPYPPNYFPYGHYFNPYFLPPMHQFLTHNGLPQLPSTSNAYLGPSAAAPGVNFPVPQFKPGTSNGNPTPIGIQSLYGTYGSSPVGFNPGSVVTSGNSASNEDLSASQLKESQIYETGPLSDVSAWISPPGQDASSFHLNSLYHVTPQGQHLTFSPAQPGHGPFPGIYGPVQTIAAPSTVNPLLQQSQGVSAAVETVGHPVGAYQQTQLAQINWNSSY